MTQLRVLVARADSCGTNLVRNFRGSPDWDLVAGRNLDAARRTTRPRVIVEVEPSLEAWSRRLEIDAVMVPTPAETRDECPGE